MTLHLSPQDKLTAYLNFILAACAIALVAGLLLWGLFAGDSHIRPLLLGSLSALAGLLGIVLQLRAAKLRSKRRTFYVARVAKVADAAKAAIAKAPITQARYYTSAVDLLVKTNVAASSFSWTPSLADESLAELRSQLAELTKRVEASKNEIVEVHKIDPVLEATLNATIDNLAKQMERLEARQLEKWDVAVICMQLLGAIGVAVAIVFGVARYVAGK